MNTYQKKNKMLLLFLLQQNAWQVMSIIGKTKSAILKNEKYIFWCFPAISGASV